jgi:AcrR family transcriptional regulator
VNRQRENGVAIVHVPASEELLKTELLTNTPVQARSNARLTALLDATAAVTQDKGYENLTTADVAKEAGASIGTVYRYFKDRVRILRALSVRNFERANNRFVEAVGDPAVTTAPAAIVAFFDLYVDMFRTEPGFRSLRLGDVLDVRKYEDDSNKNIIHTRTSEPRSRIAARTMSAVLHDKFGSTDNDATVLHLEKTMIVVDAYLDRAFRDSETGDPRFIEAARATAAELAGQYA